MNFFDFHHHQCTKTTGIYNLNIGELLPNSFFSAGIHPNLSAEAVEIEFEWLREVSQNKNCLAIGECGLDGFVESIEQRQEDLFERQIELANELQKPLIIHCVRRFAQLIHYQKRADIPMIVHGFNKRNSIGDELIKHDFYLSFGKSVLQNVNLQEFVKDFPIEKLFLETDDLDFDIEILYQKVADLKNLKMENLILQIEENLKIFNIP